jgi:hypothetical protein
MKKVLGAAVLVMLFSVPALAQARTTGSTAPNTTSSGGGGGVSLSGGGGYGNKLPSYPRASFATTAASGGDSSFAPSTFLSFDQAVAEGKAVASTVQKTLGEVAAENNATAKAKAKYEFVQDANGRVVPTQQ